MITITPTQTRPVTAADVRTVARALARAFEHDPVGAWFLPDERDRLRRLERGFASVYVKRLALPHGAALTTQDTAGAALWIPPNAKLPNLTLLPYLAAAWGRHLRRAMKGMALMDAHHPHEPHYYLPIIGVDPVRQGEGIGSALLRPVLERADAEGMPAYLEATTPGNRRLYERHGFALTEEIHLPYDGPPLALMWREPQR